MEQSCGEEGRLASLDMYMVARRCYSSRGEYVKPHLYRHSPRAAIWFRYAFLVKCQKSTFQVVLLCIAKNLRNLVF